MITKRKKETVLTRKNKTYTTIFITDFSDETLQESIKLKEENRYSIIKPKMSAFMDYINRYDVENKLNQAVNEKVGYQFEIGGYWYTKIKDMENCVLTLRDETDYKNNATSDFGMFNLSGLLIESVFKHKTGRLMYF